MKPDCSIIIRAFNEEKHIARLLEGIFQQTIKDIEVILVDSGSLDGTVEIAKKFPVEIVHIKPIEFTFGRSLNMGINAAKSDLIVLASAHIYPVYPDWLERLLDPFSDNRVALTYGKQRGIETTHFSEKMIFSHWFPDISNWHQDHPFCNNANAAIRRDLWAEHSYNENLPGLEDLAWARWAFDQGYQIAYVSEAEIVHVHNETWRGISNRYKREGMAFKTIYPQESFSKKDFFKALLSNVRNDFQAASKEKSLPKHWKQIIAFRWNQFLGTYQGYNQSGPLTWKLKQTFYYPRISAESKMIRRSIDPIQYQDQTEKVE
ncbi:MAG: family 2 glycosyl transferase [Chloroflexi bacterium HGW-Chloroflexi-8]|nr:MAG: family 2 glycosyl transferase [Chloroflexi bacterium HGW-Chloroflexi-8]